MPTPTLNTPAASSYADGIAVHLALDGKSADFGPIAPVQGSAGPGYDKAASIAQLDHTLDLEPGNPLDPSLQVQASAIDTEAASSGMGIDSISASGATNVGSANFVLLDNPLAPGGILSLLGLSVSATRIHATAAYTHVYGMNKSSVTGDTTFGSLSLGGTAIGKTLTFSGDAAPNTVLFSSPTITVTLDRQTVADLISNDLTKTLTPTGVVTEAIDISLHNAPMFGGKVSGDIIIGQASAGAGSLPAWANPHA